MIRLANGHKVCRSLQCVARADFCRLSWIGLWSGLIGQSLQVCKSASLQ